MQLISQLEQFGNPEQIETITFNVQCKHCGRVRTLTETKELFDKSFNKQLGNGNIEDVCSVCHDWNRKKHRIDEFIKKSEFEGKAVDKDALELEKNRRDIHWRHIQDELYIYGYEVTHKAFELGLFNYALKMIAKTQTDSFKDYIKSKWNFSIDDYVNGLYTKKAV